jgi:hypothetical protein
MEQRYNQLIFVLYQSSQKEQPRQQTINMNKRWKINSRKMFPKAHRKILASKEVEGSQAGIVKLFFVVHHIVSFGMLLF